MYGTGLLLTLVYLILVDAMAAWVPLTVEIAGCCVIVALKFKFDREDTEKMKQRAEHQQESINDISKHSAVSQVKVDIEAGSS